MAKKPAKKSAKRRVKKTPAPLKKRPAAPAPPPRPVKPHKFTAAQMKAIEKSLHDEEERLKKAMREQADDEMGDAGAVGDVVDAAANAATSFLTIGLTTVEARTLKEIREALARIESGTYGVCRRCAGGVERERLEAIPWAPTCIACRRDEERLEQTKEPRKPPPASDFNSEG